jgi:hypothetical protein
MATAPSGHVVAVFHAHAKPWAWHPFNKKPSQIVVAHKNWCESRPNERLSSMFNHAFRNERTPTRRMILLGASNLVQSFPILVATVQSTWSAPVEIMAAMGHGRSYGQDTNVFGRKISGIFPCALWQDLQSRPSMPTAALITDIGNDLLYGVSVERLVDWVTRCVDRALEAGAEVVVTKLPIASLEGLGETRFRFFRRMFFPRSSLTLADALAHARAINDRLSSLEEMKKISVIPVSAEWYGLDPIHLTRYAKPIAWPTILSMWRAADAPQRVATPSVWTAAYLASLAPWERSILGVTRRAAQPSGRLSDGTTISLY